MSTTTVDFIRHGEPVGGSRYRGQTDDPLSEKGWRQMRAAVADCCPWDMLVSSPLIRCRAFAEELAARHGRPLDIEPRFREIGFGAWEGRTATELMAGDPDILRRFWSDPEQHTPPGGEPLAQFRDRIVAAWDDLLGRHAGRHVLVIGHAGTVRMVLRHVLDMPLGATFRIQVGNAAVTRIRVDSEAGRSFPRLLFHGGRLEDSAD
jgi:alpha-ribazole phosphatase/probable phosphoglycerate mutase